MTIRGAIFAIAGCTLLGAGIGSSIPALGADRRSHCPRSVPSRRNLGRNPSGFCRDLLRRYPSVSRRDATCNDRGLEAITSNATVTGDWRAGDRRDG